MKSKISVAMYDGKPCINIEHRSGDGEDSILSEMLTQFKDIDGKLSVNCFMVATEPSNYMRGYRLQVIPNKAVKLDTKLPDYEILSDFTHPVFKRDFQYAIDPEHKLVYRSRDNGHSEWCAWNVYSSLGGISIVPVVLAEKPKQPDNVNHPSHYTSGKIEVIDFMEDQKLDIHTGNAVKYIARAGKKDPAKEVEDLEKAIWYLKRKISKLTAV